jgi:CRP-like cAMP-binding protein
MRYPYQRISSKHETLQRTSRSIDFRNIAPRLPPMMTPFRIHLHETVHLEDDEFALVQSHFEEKRYLKNHYLIQEGNPVENDYFVLAGLVKSFYVDEDGKEHILQFAREGSWVTDLQAYYHGKKASLNVACIEDTTVLSISTQKRAALCISLPKMEIFFRQKSTTESITLQRRILCLISNNTRARYDDFIRQYPDLTQRLPKSMIASYLGVSRETLSRLLNTQA